MAWVMKEGQGTLFKNEKRTKETHPHAKGTALIGGVEYEIAAWTKDGARGEFQSLSFKPKDHSNTRTAPPATRAGQPDDDGMPPF